jgi:hypothetical protein
MRAQEAVSRLRRTALDRLDPYLLSKFLIFALSLKGPRRKTNPDDSFPVDLHAPFSGSLKGVFCVFGSLAGSEAHPKR